MRILKFIYRKFLIFFLNFLFNKKKENHLTFGSKYGSWSFLNSKNLYNSTIISCGVGEDISFDIEMMNKFNLSVIFIDPTPRAIEYYDQIVDNIGKNKTKNYSNDGNQPIETYDLSNIKLEKMQLIKKAIWSENLDNKIFYSPKNKNNVSYSFSDFSNNYKKETSHINVMTITYRKLIHDLNIKSLPLIKLDIEGSETEVIQDLLNNYILPDQILVEFDELTTYEIRKFKKYYNLDKKLKSKGYIAINIKSFSNQLYVKKECLKKLH